LHDQPRQRLTAVFSTVDAAAAERIVRLDNAASIDRRPGLAVARIGVKPVLVVGVCRFRDEGFYIVRWNVLRPPLGTCGEGRHAPGCAPVHFRPPQIYAVQVSAPSWQSRQSIEPKPRNVVATRTARPSIVSCVGPIVTLPSTMKLVSPLTKLSPSWSIISLATM